MFALEVPGSLTAASSPGVAGADGPCTLLAQGPSPTRDSMHIWCLQRINNQHQLLLWLGSKGLAVSNKPSVSKPASYWSPKWNTELLNYSNSRTSQVMFLQAFSWLAFLSGSSGTAVSHQAWSLMKDLWCPHPRHPHNSANGWVLYYGDTDLSKLSSPTLIISAPWGHTPPCHCPSN